MVNFNEADFVINTQAGASQTGDREQVISITDMLCEGPVQGLVDKSASSVYLDDVPAENASFAGVYNNGVAQDVEGTISFSGSSTTGTVTDGPLLPTSDTSVIRQLVLTNYLETATFGTISVGTYEANRNITVITFTNSETYNNSWLTATASSRRAVLYTDTRSYEGQITAASGNSLTLEIYGDAQDLGIDASVSTYRVKVKVNITLQSNTSNSVTTTGFTPASGSYNFVLTEAATVPRVFPGVRGFYPKIDDFQLQFRDGSLNQNPISEINGAGGVASFSYVPSSSGTIKQLDPDYLDDPANKANFSLIDFANTQYPENTGDYAAAPIFIQSTDIAGSNGPLPGNIDELIISIGYPNGLCTTNLEKGAKEMAHSFFRFDIQLLDDNGSPLNNGEFANCFPNYGSYVIHKGKTTSPVAFEHVISLDQFRPFSNFRLRISRLTRHAGLPVTANGTAGGRTNNDKWLLTANAQINGGIQVVSKDKFSYPFTAIANVNFSSQRYQSTPSRSYLMQGLKVRIPSNYTPREQSPTGEAEYNGFWDGQFKEGLHYTDNPAWVFYDLVVNNRYGAGEWISAEDVDVYALYRIAKYCDELVDDGKGGQEPRFRANVYLTKATDVYKVLKDMASIFTGMLYWMDSKLTVIQDVAQDPIFNFSQSNVIDGKFGYESTGLKTRANQAIVTWNDPNRNYEPSPVIVEDRESIVRTGRIISEEAVAFGATSEGQAIRYGRWKLWTAQNQTESISFATGMQGAYIRPGDVISVQDNARYDTALSGRIKSVSLGASDVTVTLDRATSLNPGDQVAFSFLVTKPVAIYTGTSDGTFSKGTAITEEVYIATPGGTVFKTIDTEEEAANAYKDPGLTDPIQNVWKKHTYVHTTTDVTEGSGTDTVLLTGSDTFDLVSSLNLSNIVGTVWSMKAVSSTVDFLGDAKEYRVLSIAQNDKHQYEISAVEYYREKYAAVDTDYALGVLPSSDFLPENVREPVPAPGNIYVISETDPTRVGEEITVEWDTVKESYIAGYELHHNVDGVQSPIRTASNSVYFDTLTDGVYTFRVRAVSAGGNVSDYTSVEYNCLDPFNTNVPRVQEGIPSGLVANCTAYYNSSSNRIVFEKLPYVVTSIGNPENAVSISQIKNYVPLGHIPYNNMGTNRQYSLAYLSSGPFAQEYVSNSHYHTLAYFDTTTLQDLPHWRFLEPGVQHAGSISSDYNWMRVGVGLNSKVELAAGSNRLIGTNTQFLTGNDSENLKIRDIVQFTGTAVAPDAGIRGAVVVAVISDTEVLLDRNFEFPVSANTNLYRRTIRPDYVRDAIWGTVTRISDTPEVPNFTFTKNIRVDSELLGRGAVVLDCSTSFLNYTTDGTPIGHPPTITATATAIGYITPIFKITATAPLSGDEEFFGANLNSNGYEKEIYAGSEIPFDTGDPLTFSVTVTEQSDPDNPANIRTAEFEISKVSEAAAGRDAKSVKLTAEDYTIIYDQYGKNPEYSTAVDNGSISLTAVASLFENPPLFRFTSGAGSGIWFSTGTNTINFDQAIPNDITGWAGLFGEDAPNGVYIVEAAEVPAGWDQGAQTPAPTVEATDSISIKALVKGQDGIAISFSNESHVLPLLIDGTIVSTGSGTTIEVIRGGVPLTFVAPGSSPGPEEWTIGSTSTTDDIAIDVGTISGAGGTIATVGDHTFSTGIEVTEQVTYNLLIGTPSGGSTSIQRKQSFSLSTPGQDGIDGNSTAIVYLYKAANEIPTAPQNVSGFPNIEVDLATGKIVNFPTSGTDGWIADLSTGTLLEGQVWWLVAATASSSSVTDLIAPGEWTDPPIQFTGWNGISSATIELFKVTSSADEPDPPSGTLTVTFSSGFNPVAGASVTTSWNGTADDGWVSTPPSLDSTNDYLWRITAAALTRNETDTITTDDWSSPSISGVYVEGQPGSGTAVVFLYNLAEEGSSVSDPNTDVNFPDITVDLTTGKPTDYTPYDGWVTEPPLSARGEVVWVITASANGSGDTDVVERLEWSAPSIFSGFDGFNSGFIALYQATSTNQPPDKPTGTFDYNFNTGISTPEFAGNFNGWGDLDSIGDLSPINAYIWITTIAPSSSSSTTTFTGTDFSTPRLIANYAADGQPGGTGDDGLRTATFFIYYDTPSATTAGIPTPTATSFDFSSFALTGLPSGWDLSAPEFQPSNGEKYWYSTVTVLEDTPAGSGIATGGNISFGPIRATIGFSGLVTFSNSSTLSDGENSFNYTAINGNWIETGTIRSQGYDEVVGSDYSTTGTKFDLTTGALKSENFAIDAAGNAKFKGSIELSSITAAGGATSSSVATAQSTASTALTNITNLQNNLLDSATDPAALETAVNNFAPIQGVDTTGGILGLSSNNITINPSNIQLSSLSGSLADTQIPTNVLQVSSTDIQAGKIVLNTSGILFAEAGASISTTNSITMDTTGGNNSITIYDGGTPRVKLGKL